jgi:Flp pilus assembly protein TadD
LIQYVPQSTRRVLDVGCSGGDFGRRLKELGVEEVIGIELDSRACALAKGVLNDAIEGNIETIDLPFEEGYFDCITFGDVLEHLINPAAVLRKVARFLAHEGVILMCIPNVRFYDVVQMLINGRWNYADAGILDRTHLRFFTAAEIRLMIEDTGLELLHLGPLSIAQPEHLPLNPDRTLSLVNAVIGPLTDEDYQEFRTYQFLAVAGKPGIDRLASARQALHEERYDAAIAIASGAYGVDEVERRIVLGSALARLGQLGEAEKLYKEALDTRPGDPEALGKLGILYVAMNRLAEARPCLESALEKGGNDRARGALGLVHLSQGRPDEAFIHFAKALESSYDNHALLPHFITTAHHLGRLPEVVDTVRRFADFYPGNPDLACACAQVLAELDMKDEARTRLESILLFNPHHEPIRALLSKLAEDSE